MNSEDRAQVAAHVLVGVLVALGFFWLRDEIHFWLTKVCELSMEELFSINSLGWLLVAAIPLFALDIIGLLLVLANYLYLFCILAFVVCWFLPLPISLNLKIGRGIRYLFGYILRFLRYVLATLFLFTVGEYSRRRGVRSFFCYVVLPFVALALIAVGTWGLLSRVSRPQSEPSQGIYRTVPVRRQMAEGFKLDQLKATPAYTELSCLWYEASRYGWSPNIISSKTNLVDQSGTTYYVYRSEGLDLDRPIGIPYGKPVRFFLYFPPLPPETDYVTLNFMAPGPIWSFSPQGVGKIWLKSPLERFLSRFRK
jgi:hypothetical protein